MNQFQILEKLISDENEDRMDGFSCFLDKISKIDINNYSNFNTEEVISEYLDKKELNHDEQLQYFSKFYKIFLKKK